MLASAQTLAQNLTTLAIFNKPDGTYPSAGLIADANGNLFGTTAGGGAYYGGTVVRDHRQWVPRFRPILIALRGAGRHRRAAPRLRPQCELWSGRGQHRDQSARATGHASGRNIYRNNPARLLQATGLWTGRHGLAFNGTIGGASLSLDILSLGNNSYQFGAGATPVNLTSNPVSVSLSIGNNSGSTSVNATRVPRLAATGPQLAASAQ